MAWDQACRKGVELMFFVFFCSQEHNWFCLTSCKFRRFFCDSTIIIVYLTKALHFFLFQGLGLNEAKAKEILEAVRRLLSRP